MLREIDVDLETAARVAAGDAVVVLGRGSRRYTTEQLAADKAAMHDELAQLQADLVDLEWRWLLGDPDADQ